MVEERTVWKRCTMVHWYNEQYGNWIFGGDEDLGTNISSVSGPFGIDEWPNDLSFGWKYKSIEAGNDIIIEGKQNHFIAASTQSHQVKLFNSFLKLWKL